MGKTTPVGYITSPDTLPSEIRDSVSQLCRLAFYGIESNKVTFRESDLTELCISKNVSEEGLLQSVPSIISDGHQTYYCFLHLSLQELLAAVYISQMSSNQQISFFQEMFGTPRFNTVFQFYAGITKLRTSRPWLSKLPRFMCPVPASVYDLLRSLVKKQLLFWTSKTLLISILHCLYEANDSLLCSFVANLITDQYFSLGATTLSPLDCLSVGYFLSVVSTSVSTEFTVNLQHCSISDQGCKFLVKGMYNCLNSPFKITSQLSVNLRANIIYVEGINHIAQLLKNTALICELDLSYNVIRESGLKSLCESLSTNTSLKKLYLIKCLITITEENVHLVCKLLSTNTSLRHLSLSNNKITDCHHIAVGLSNNKGLQKLGLNNCSLTDDSVIDLSSGLSNYTEELDIGQNESVTNAGLEIFATNVTFSRLRCLRAPYRGSSSIFSEVNQKRRRNGLHEIKVVSAKVQLIKLFHIPYFLD